MHYWGIWHTFVWELGKFLFGKLAKHPKKFMFLLPK